MAERSGSRSGVADKRELVIRRTFDAPRELVWKAFTELERARQWWGPKDFTVPVLEMDMRPGGAWHAVMRSPDGKEYPQSGVYREIVPPERLVFTLIWDDEGPDSEMLCTFTFAERGNKTEMTFRKGPFTSEKRRKGEEEGWNECFDRLEALVETR
jgi:uncharacterized protein YndB with AHSA1/START domain